MLERQEEIEMIVSRKGEGEEDNNKKPYIRLVFHVRGFTSRENHSIFN